MLQESCGEVEVGQGGSINESTHVLNGDFKPQQTVGIEACGIWSPANEERDYDNKFRKE
jgi:hypothetical protein